MKKALRIFLIVLAAVLLIAAAYFLYLLIDYSRIEDMQPAELSENAEEALPVGTQLRAMTWNMGFCAYSADYSFFMDGGSESRAYSRDAVLENLNGMLDVMREVNPDLLLLQEVDTDSTRSWHVNERETAEAAFENFSASYAVNFHSSYLMYPLLQPHGASNSGILTLADAPIESALRRQLPIETSLMRFLDLDRCYCVNRIPTADGRTLCLYNLHLSAYTSDGSIANRQIEMLLEDMRAEVEAGNYVIASGDFNKDLPGNSSELFNGAEEKQTWSQPFPAEMLPEGLRLVNSLDEEAPVASCRNADTPYVRGETYVLIVDGFIVSDNVRVDSCAVRDEGFAYTDHNPVVMEFSLEG